MNAILPAPLDWRHGLLLFFAVLVVALPQATLLPLLDRDEPRFAEASREMVQSGDFIVPTFNHAPRYAKPPLIYWCQAAAFTLFGENAFAARLPSLLATAATAWIIAAWGARLGGTALGIGAALCYAFCLQTVQQGRVATADALLIFFMTLTSYAGWRIITDPPVSHSKRSYAWDTVLALGFTGGFLAKGPEAFLPLLPLFYCAHGHGRRITGEIVVNFLIGVCLVLFWAVPAYIKTNGDYWHQGMSEGVGQRMVSGLQGHGSAGYLGYILFLLYYPVLFLLSALPWSLLLVRSKKLFSGWKTDGADTYLLLNAALIFLVFSLMVTKLPHYTLPAFPFLALFLVKRWISVGLSPEWPQRLACGFCLAFTLLTLLIVPIALFNANTPSPVGELVRDADTNLTPDTQFALVDFEEPNTIWEMRRVVTGFGPTIAPARIHSFLDQPGPHAVILSTALWEKLGGDSVDSDRKVFHARGLNAAKIRIKGPYFLPVPEPLSLTLIVKP